MYRSPFRIIDVDALPRQADALSRALALEKKKLLAEFELAERATIVYRGLELHRQDLISMFGELAIPNLLSYHQAIWRDDVLLEFLENGRMVSRAGWLQEDLYCNPNFLRFISPFFAGSCNLLLQRILNEGDAGDELAALQMQGLLILAPEMEAAYRYATRFFTEKKNELLAIRLKADDNVRVTIAEIRLWCNDEQIHCLNRLPDTFSALRYALANTLNNLCVAFDRKNANKHALAAVERAATIRVDDEELNELIPANLRIIRNKQSKGLFNTNPDTGRKTPKIGWIIALFIVIIRFATAGDGCNSHRTDIRDFPATFPHEKPAVEWKISIPGNSDSSSIALTSLDSMLKKLPVYTTPKAIQDSMVLPATSGMIVDTTFRDIAKKAANDSSIIWRPR